jgi:hypothetical protein
MTASFRISPSSPFTYLSTIDPKYSEIQTASLVIQERTEYYHEYQVWLYTGSGLIIGFISPFDTPRDFNLYTHNSVHSHVFTSRCSVAASNSGHSPSSVFSDSPRLQLPPSNGNSSQRLNSVTHQQTELNRPELNSTQLSLTVLLIIPQHGSHKKYRFIIDVKLLPW